MKEYRALQKEAAEDIVLYPKDEGDLLHWRAYIVGPPDTPFEGMASPPLPSFFFDAGCAAAWEAEPFCCTAGGRFELDIVVPKNYPLRPPKIHFITKIFHPNIHFKTGEICLDLVRSSFTLRAVCCAHTHSVPPQLKSAWSAVYTLQSVCRSIIALLSHPEPDSPLNCDCGKHYHPMWCVRVCYVWCVSCGVAHARVAGAKAISCEAGTCGATTRWRGCTPSSTRTPFRPP